MDDELKYWAFISYSHNDDGCEVDTVPLAVGRWYDFHEFGWHLGNVS